MNLNFTDATHFDVDMVADGQPYECKQESYTFDAGTGSISTNVRNASDCLNGGVKKHYDDPDTVFFSYVADSHGGHILLRIDTVDMELAPAACGLTSATIVI